MVGVVLVAAACSDDGAARLVTAATERSDLSRLGLILPEGNPVDHRRFGFQYAMPHGIDFDLPGWAPPEAGHVLRLSNYHPSIRGKVVYPLAVGVVDGT